MNNYINLCNNDKLTELNNKELLDFIYLTYTSPLEYYPKLGLNNNITFGVELEFEVNNVMKIHDYLIKNGYDPAWLLHKEISISQGYEISSPPLQDTKEDWHSLKDICTFLNECTIITNRCGSHIHIGSQILKNKPKNLLNLMLLWSVYENIIYRFSYGNINMARPKIMIYAKTARKLLWDKYLEVCDKKEITLEKLLKGVADKRSTAINFYNLKDISSFTLGSTIEIRTPNGTLLKEIWQNNINFFVKLLQYATKDDFNEEIMVRRHFENIGYVNEYKDYEKLFLEQALELSDLIFDNNRDKINFLKIYLKLFDQRQYNNIKRKVLELRK